METVDIKFPTVELPANHYWLIIPMADYWSVEIIEIYDERNEFDIVASYSHISFDTAVTECFIQLERFYKEQAEIRRLYEAEMWRQIADEERKGEGE